MNKQFIVLSLLLLNLKMMCSAALPCLEISYSNKKVEELNQPNIRHSKYGFETHLHPLTLTYNEQLEYGVISQNNQVVELLTISKEQFLKIADEVKNGSSIANFEYNKEVPLKVPLYITGKENRRYYMAQHFISYKVEWLNRRKFSEIDAALYELGKNEERAFFNGTVVGMAISMAGFAIFLAFAVVTKKFIYR